MIPYYDDGQITLYHGDCLDLHAGLREKPDLVLTDPPYGINHPTDYKSRGRGTLANARDYAPVAGDDQPFDPAPLLEIAPCILWGANYYADKLPISNSWLVWDKRERQSVGDTDQADGELAWSNATKGVRIFRHLWNGYWRASERKEFYHPTQKPVALMQWALEKAKLEPGALVYDPYAGAGPVAVACKKMGLRYVGVELVEDYCAIAARRLGQTAMVLG